ncbi:MAG: hypothetical protein HGB19_03555 [Chlorobiales bacterium]|nr:hypothetical protein [Chlorobiales bacterium]
MTAPSSIHYYRNTKHLCALSRQSGRRSPFFILSTLSLLLLFLTGCAMQSNFYAGVEKNMGSGNFTEASKQIQKNKNSFGTKSDVLYNLEMGTLLHYAGKYEESNSNLFEAERRMDELFTKSITEQASSFLLNDNVLPYEGEDFEKVFVNLFLALNYACMDNFEDALVEARKVDVKLNEFSRKYDGKNCYKEDALVRYLMGAMYESGGELNDAYISYVKAYEGYQDYEKLYGTHAPSFLQDDLIRTAGLLGFKDDLRRYEKLFNKQFQRPSSAQGSAIVIIYSGKGPIKQEVKISPTIPDKDGMPHTFAIAVPKFQARMKSDRRYTVSLANSPANASIAAEVGQNITKIAEKDLNDRLTLIYLKAGGRALLKFLAVEAAKGGLKKDKKDKKDKKNKDSQIGNILFGALLDVAYSASEQADVRTWRSLPHQIQVARIFAPSGSYTLSVTSSGRTVTTVPVDVRSQKATFKVIPDVN